METRKRQEEGYVLVALMAAMVPLVLIVGTFTMTMNGHTRRIQGEIDQERALMAAESGLDEGIYQAKLSCLSSGVSFSRDLGNEVRFTVDPTLLKTDGLDNDSDGFVDESDEDVFQLIITGRFRNTTRRIAAYLGPVPIIAGVEAGLTVHNPGVVLDLKGTPQVSGYNTNMDGTLAGTGDVPGLAIDVATGAGTAYLDSQLSAAEEPKVIGPGGPPSLGEVAAVDIDAVIAAVQNSASIVLTNNIYPGLNFGNGAAGVANIIYRDGNVTFNGNSTGAGIMVVTGDLTMMGNFRFDGLLIVLGNVINASGTANLYGGVVQGPTGGSVVSKGTFNLKYSKQAIDLATSLVGRYVSFNGWQELAR